MTDVRISGALPDSRRTASAFERTVVTLTVAIAVAATISIVSFVSLNGACPNPNGIEGLHIVAAPRTVWDEQAVLNMDVNESTLTSNVSVNSAEDSNGYGPVYLLNGVTNSGYWYQVGIAFNWGADGGYAVGAEVVTSIFAPADSAAPVYEFVRAMNVSSGDLVTLSMSLTGGCASLSVSDSRTRASATENYNLEESTRFVSSPSLEVSTGFFSGLMTEWWHVTPYYGPTGSAIYSLPQHSGTFVGLGISERVPISGPLLFANSTRGNLALPGTWTLMLQNVTESVNQTTFVTQ